MTRLFPDTTPEAERVLIEMMRRAPATRKLQMMGEMNAAARHLALQGLRARHPEATDAQLRRYLADLLLGSDLAARASGPRPADDCEAEPELYRKAAEVSDQQWLELLSVLAAESGDAVGTYLRQWAPALGVSDLLERTLRETSA
jgi:hypothetical protein